MNTRVSFLISLTFTVSHFSFGQNEGKCVTGNCVNGIGTYVYKDGSDDATYKGSFKNGKFNGIGTITLHDGEKFSGNYNDGKLNGKGKWTFAPGRQYDGEFKDTKFDGYGIYKFEDGSVYKGNWTGGKQNGKGDFFDKTGKLDYSGEWNNGEMVEPGNSVSYKKNLWEGAQQVFGRTTFKGTMEGNQKVSHEYHLSSDFTLKGTVITHDISDNVCDRDFTGTYDPVHYTLHLVYGTIRLHTTKSNGDLYTSFEGESDAEVFFDPDHKGYFQIIGKDGKGQKFAEADYQ